MKNLLLGSATLTALPATQTGELNISDLLKKNAELANVELPIDLPEQTLTLKWAEMKTPRFVQTGSLGKEMLSGRLHDYKFQYLGKFVYGDQEIMFKDWTSKKTESEYESFAARLGDRVIHQTSLEGVDGCNCTWLIDFLMNADKKAENSKDKIRWKKTYDGYRLTLTGMSADGRVSEAHNFVFSSDFKHMKWEQHAAIGELVS